MKKIQGFTLIELMIVVAIIGILSAIAIPKFADLIRKSNEGATKGNLGAIRSAVSIYYGEQEGVFPAPTTDGTDAVPTSLGGILTSNNGTYIKAMPNCYTPPYHPATNSTTIAVSSADETTGAGGWGYQPNATPAANARPYGDVWVNCTHVDSKGTTWGVY